MPTYDYICTSCDHAWELEQRIVEPPVKQCPACGAATAKRQISSGAGFILKGGGWYADGYGSKKPSSEKPQDKGEKGEKKAETKSDTPQPDPGKTDTAKGEGSKKGGSSEPKASAA
jgi:putative FmdB family regulatory protein